MYLVIIEEELWTQLKPSNFQNSTLEIITITVTEIIFIQVFFYTVASKQKNKE